MDLQSSIEIVSKIVEIVSKIQEIVSKTDARVVVGIISLGGVIFTAFMTAWNVNKTNNLKKELEDQANNLKIELADQTNEITKELGEKNLKALEQRRYIDAISTERVKWINSLRDNFSAFIKNVNIQMSDIDKLKSEKPKVDEEKMRERLNELMYIGNHIFFLLNPTEPICIKIGSLQNQIVKFLEKYNSSDFDYDKVQDLMEKLAFFYQVVLKAEWKRVKEENKEGKEISEVRMNKIYKETAKNLNSEGYKNKFSEMVVKALN